MGCSFKRHCLAHLCLHVICLHAFGFALCLCACMLGLHIVSLHAQLCLHVICLHAHLFANCIFACTPVFARPMPTRMLGYAYHIFTWMPSCLSCLWKVVQDTPQQLLPCKKETGEQGWDTCLTVYSSYTSRCLRGTIPIRDVNYVSIKQEKKSLSLNIKKEFFLVRHMCSTPPKFSFRLL